MHYLCNNLGQDLSHIYQIPCLRQEAHCLNKSNTATWGSAGGQTGRQGQMVGDLALWSPIHTGLSLADRQSQGICSGFLSRFSPQVAVFV